MQVFSLLLEINTARNLFLTFLLAAFDPLLSQSFFFSLGPFFYPVHNSHFENRRSSGLSQKMKLDRLKENW